MKKRIVSIILAVTVIVCMIPFSTFSAFAEEISDNEEDTVIEISELSLLQSFAQSVNTGDTDFSDVTVRLTGDIGSEEDDCQVTVYEEVPATCVAFGTKAYYEFKGDYFKDPECNNKIDDLTAWLKNYTESGGLILPLGHMGVPCENVTKGHYCLREGCPYAGEVLMHDFNDDDTACPACGVRCAKGCDHDPTCSDFYAFYAEFKNDGSALTSTWYYIDESITLDTPLIIAGEDVRLLIADNVTLNAAAGYYVKSGSSFDVYYQSRGENAGKFEGTVCKCYDETNMEAYFDHSDVDTDGICDHCLKAVTKYLDENGDETYIDTENLNVIPSDATEIRSGWYIADYEGGKLASFSERLKITGDVHIILLDSKNVISRSGIAVNKGNTLSFYSQSLGDKMGKFETYGVTDAYIGCAGIGGSLGNPDAGTVNIYGGGFKIYAGTGAAAIGGGLGGDGATVTVYNGDINASGSIGAAGIGGGFNGDGVSFVMYGGTVNAKAGTGATAGQDGAGIGGGYNGTSGKIEIANTIASLTANGGRALGSGKGIVQDVNSIKLAKGLLATSNGKTVENIDIETEIVIVPENNKYNGISLTLDSDICMNFYMELSEDARENGKMVFTIGGRTVEDVTVQQNPNGYYFTCPLTALEMATEVEATFSYEGLKYKQTYSVEEYIQSILDGNYSDETKTLARKIANYGHYAQSYLADIHNKVTIGDGGYAPMEKYSQCDIDAETDIGRFTDEFEAPAPTNDYELYGRTVYFDSATALNYYVTVKNGNSLTADAITCFDKGGNNRNFEVKFFKDDIYIVSVKGIAATELNDTFKVTIGDSFVLESSVLNYCGAVVKAHSGDTSSDKLAVNAMAAFYEYYDAATDYAESLGK